jgi:hypothetical protein
MVHCCSDQPEDEKNQRAQSSKNLERDTERENTVRQVKSGPCARNQIRATKITRKSKAGGGGTEAKNPCGKEQAWRETQQESGAGIEKTKQNGGPSIHARTDRTGDALRAPGAQNHQLTGVLRS